MGYGTLKADTLIYDNSGDQTVTVQSLAGKASSASPTFTGTPAAPTAAADTNTTQIATTAYVQSELGDYATLAAPALTGNATAVNLTLSGDLTVNGTTTTINSTTLAVDDKNIELGTVDTPSDTTADGGGITLKGATDKEIKWLNATDSWTFNQSIEITAGSIVLGVADSASGHINAYENMTFNIDTDNDDVNRTFKFCTGAQNGAGNVILEIDEAGYATFSGSVTDNKGDLRSIPQTAKTATHTLVAADAGKHISTDSSVTLPPSVFSAGQAITIYNNSGSDIPIYRGTGVTLYLATDGSNANRTISTRGLVTILCVASNEFVISGAGLS